MKFEFPHQAPEGYRYEVEPFQRNVVAIWIHHCRRFDYNLGHPVRCIWGFYNSKTGNYHSPVNSKTIGSAVDINLTTAYSAMILNKTPLETAFV